jgi:hypothetical protein
MFSAIQVLKDLRQGNFPRNTGLSLNKDLVLNQGHNA